MSEDDICNIKCKFECPFCSSPQEFNISTSVDSEFNYICTSCDRDVIVIDKRTANMESIIDICRSVESRLRDAIAVRHIGRNNSNWFFDIYSLKIIRNFTLAVTLVGLVLLVVGFWLVIFKSILFGILLLVFSFVLSRLANLFARKKLSNTGSTVDRLDSFEIYNRVYYYAKDLNEMEDESGLVEKSK